MKKSKLHLSTDTIRRLTDANLTDVRGGQAEADAPNPFPISLNCNGSWPCSAFTCKTLISCKC